MSKMSLFWKTQFFYFKIILRVKFKSLISFFCVSMLGALMAPLIIFYNKKIIDSLANLSTNGTMLKYTLILLFMLFVFQFAQATFNNLKNYIFKVISENANFKLKEMLFIKLESTKLDKYESSEFFDKVQLASIAINTNGIRVVSDIVGILGSLISLISILGLLISIHWSMPVALFLSTLPGIILILLTKFKAYNITKKNASNMREISYTESLFTKKSAIKEMKVYELGEYLIEKWRHSYQTLQKHNLNLELWSYKANTVSIFILQLSSMVVSALLILQISNHNLSIGDYVALTGAVLTVQALFAGVGGNLGSIFETLIYSKALMEIINSENNEEKKEVQNTIPEFEFLHLKNVSFCYKGSTTYSLKNISLKINKGQKISIVGANGSGKSTLINCILGMYKVESGEVLWNGANIKEFNEKKYLKKFSSVFQEFEKFKYSIRENIAFGNLSEIDDNNKIYKVLEKVGFINKYKQFQDGLNTYLTKEVYGGQELSGGEWQKIALSRSFFKDSDLIILDEPTSALDPLTELEIFEIFKKLSREKTTITISHRLEPTKYADKILVMDKGLLIEEGEFQTLMNKKGLYYEMYTAQSKISELPKKQEL